MHNAAQVASDIRPGTAPSDQVRASRPGTACGKGIGMPVGQGNGIDINSEVQGEGEPLVLIPYLAADQACYAFQVAEYAKHFTCFTVDLRGAGLSGKPEGTYSTELLAEDV